MGNKMKAALWGLRLAWKIDKVMLLLWTSISVILAVLPAVALGYNRNIIATLSSFLSTGIGNFSGVVANIVIMGVILTIAGLSARLNDDFLYIVMYDSFYLGLEEVMMDSAQCINMTEFAKKDVRDEYFAAISRCGSLTDLTSSGCAMVAKITSIVSLLAVAVTISPVIFGFTLLYVALVLWINACFAGKIQTSWKDLREMFRKADYFEKLARDGDTAKEIRIFDCAEQIKEKWEKAYNDVEASELKHAKGMAKIALYSKLGFYVFMAGMLVYSVFCISWGSMDPALLLLIFTLCLNIADAVALLPKSYQQLNYGLYGLDIQRRVFENYAKPEPEAAVPGYSAPLDADVCFETHNLGFSYAKGKPILGNINLKIRRGETVALVGENGCGKTTLVKVLLGLYKPTAGEALFYGRPHTAYEKGFVTQRIGAFFQDFYLFHLTLGENVGLGNIKEIENETMLVEAMKKGGAAKLIPKLKLGLHNLIGKQVSKDGAVLSGGEGQRVAVSRTHMSDKEILVFDEPASMLDPLAEMEQFFNIKEKLNGRTAILVSHRIGFARLADRILVISGGSLTEDGTHEQLMQADGMYARLFREQAQWYDGTARKTQEEGTET